jgi:hypothetical protein
VTITGAGAAATILDGEERQRLISIPQGRMVTISGVSITKGDETEQGGGIVNAGILTIADSVVSKNYSTFGGGGILNSGTLTLTRSLVHDNRGHITSGGISNSGTMTLINTTVTDNLAGRSTASCGGVCNSGTMTIINSTIAYNAATLYAGGVLNRGTMVVRNTIIAGNISYYLTKRPFDCTGPITSQGHNVVGVGEGCGFTVAGDQVGSSTKPLDPLLGPLKDNGGPTMTHALLGGSPALDAGDSNACPSTDQRGILRPWDGNNDGLAVCDVGAYELNVVFTRRAYLSLVLRN